MTPDTPDTPDMPDDGRGPPAGEPPVDLSPLRGGALEALARRVEAAAAPELARRRAAAPAADVRLGRRQAAAAAGEALSLLLARAARPALLAAAAALLVAAALARGAAGPAAAPSSSAPEPFAAVIGLVSDSGVARVLSVNERDAAWIATQRTPTDDDLAVAVGLGGEW